MHFDLQIFFKKLFAINFFQVVLKYIVEGRSFFQFYFFGKEEIFTIPLMLMPDVTKLNLFRTQFCKLFCVGESLISLWWESA